MTATEGPFPINLLDIEQLAVARLPRATADYFAGAADDEVSLRANREAFEGLFLRPRCLVDVSRITTATTVLGTPVALPVLIAPTAFLELAHPEGELATTRAAAAAGTVMILSTFSTASLERVAEAASGPKWFQLYVHRDRGLTRDLVQRAAAAGYSALVLTVDVPMIGRRERDTRNGFALPPSIRVANFRLAESEALHSADGESGLAHFVHGLRDPSFSWKDVEWLGTLSSLPIVLKGVLRADDARRSLDYGVQGLIVSNHGGRQLDGAVPGIRALPDVAAAVDGAVELMVDGGIRRGTDVIKALALGARAVLIGRPVVWGLSWDGSAGVERVFQLLREELETAMGLCGAPSVDHLTRDLIA